MAQTNIITVDFEYYEGPDESIDQTGAFSASEVLRCDWDDRISLMRQLKGGYRDDESGTWILPMQYRWFERARVRTVSCRPQQSSIGAHGTYGDNDYDTALITVNYAVIQSTPDDDDPEATLPHQSSFTSSTEFLNVVVDPEKNPIYFYKAGGTGGRIPPESLPQRLITTWQWHLQIFDVKTVSANTQTMLGYVNQTAISSEYIPANTAFTFGLETLRYDGADISPTTTVDGQDRWNVTLNFSYIQLPNDSQAGISGWNHMFPPQGNVPERMYTDAAMTTIYRNYPVAAMNDLFAEYL